MKNLLLIALILFTGGCFETKTPKPTTTKFENQATYMISGIKDKRLDAWYLASYVSQRLNEGCTSRHYSTGGQRHSLGRRVVKVEDGNYTINFPIQLTGENNDCDYRFRSLELIMKRKYDEKLSSIHKILSDKQEVSPIYWKTERGSMQLQHSDTPPHI